MIEDGAQKAGFACGGAQVAWFKASQAEKPADPLAVGGEPGEGRNGQGFRVRAVRFTI